MVWARSRFEACLARWKHVGIRIAVCCDFFGLTWLQEERLAAEVEAGTWGRERDAEEAGQYLDVQLVSFWFPL